MYPPDTINVRPSIFMSLPGLLTESYLFAAELNAPRSPLSVNPRIPFLNKHLVARRFRSPPLVPCPRPFTTIIPSLRHGK